VQGRKALFQSPSSMLFAGADAFEAAGGRCQPSQRLPDYRNTLAIVGEFDPSTPIERSPMVCQTSASSWSKGQGTPTS
jgi:hypothetical protein